jgi:hypothetical protein
VSIVIDTYDAEHVGDVMRTGTHWTAHLLRLIAKSDAEHLEAIRGAFPSHVEAWERWLIRGDQP